MLGRGLFPRIGAYDVLALGFWLLFQSFERSNILMGVLGGLLILVGMYLMTGVWRDTFARFGGRPRIPREGYLLRKENGFSDETPEDKLRGTEGTSDSVASDTVASDIVDGSDQGGQLPP